MNTLQDKEVHTRKEHRCEWCGEMIETGSKARYRAYVFDGDFTSEHMHPECYAAMFEIDWNYEEGFEQHSFVRGTSMRKDEMREES